MRELTLNEMSLVSGAADDCGGGNNIGGITDTGSLGKEIIEIYEGLVAATSYIIERVAEAL